VGNVFAGSVTITAPGGTVTVTIQVSASPLAAATNTASTVQAIPAGTNNGSIIGDGGRHGDQRSTSARASWWGSTTVPSAVSTQLHAADRRATTSSINDTILALLTTSFSSSTTPRQHRQLQPGGQRFAGSATIALGGTW
jgi:hypothetical protein